MANMFSELEESKIEDGNFKADGRSKMFEKAKKLDIDGGFFLATNEKQGNGWEESDSKGCSLVKGAGRCLKSPRISLSAEEVTPPLAGGRQCEREKINRNFPNKDMD